MKLEDLSLKQLRDLAKTHNVKGVSALPKGDIVKKIAKAAGRRVKMVDGVPVIGSGAPKAVAVEELSGGTILQRADALIARIRGEGPKRKQTQLFGEDPSPAVMKEYEEMKKSKLPPAKPSRKSMEAMDDAVEGWAQRAAAPKSPKKLSPKKTVSLSPEKATVIDDGSIGGKGIEWDDIKWGKLAGKLEKHNESHDKKDMPEFADMILADPKKYSTTTVRQARFYRNVLKKKSG
jgi:hypothetical protein